MTVRVERHDGESCDVAGTCVKYKNAIFNVKNHVGTLDERIDETN